MEQQSALKQNEGIIVHVDPEIADLIPGFLDNRRNDTATTEIYTILFVGSVRCV